jgi:chromosome segregation ATPase
MSSLTYTLSRSALLISLVLSASANGQAYQATAPAGSSDAQILQELVSEVRQLRLVLARTSAISSRLQITLQRVQLQQNQVNTISDRLASVRNEIARLQTEQAQASGHLSDIDNRIEQEQNPNTQKALQSEQRYMKTDIEQKARVIQDQTSREGELAASLQSEQSKLNELQTRLDSLEKSMEAQ